jgi:hypothetical protein
MAQPTEELEQLRGFVLTVLDHLGLAVSAEALEPIRTARSIRGIREAARDMVEMCEDFTADRVSALDARLASEDLPTLTQMRDRRYTKLLTILSRGHIKSEDECRLVNAFVADMQSGPLSAGNRARANALLLAYERHTSRA